jgi:peptidoglycan/LPS O-acetylase OafA/YrhL
VVDATRADSRASRLLNRAPLVWAGGISYGLYLWHLPVILWLGPRLLTHGVPRVVASVLAVLVAVGVAAASAHWLERPILRRVRARPGGRQSMVRHPESERP